VNPRRWPIHWAWLPAAAFEVAVLLARHGWLITAVAVAAGLLIGLSAEIASRRRKHGA
jgi:hypothetical protein